MRPYVPPFAENSPIPGTKQLVIAELAAGAHGAVYLTRNRDLPNKLSVIKILHADLLDRDDLVDRMRQEAALLAAIDHPNIVSVSDAGMTSETYPRPYFQMEYLRGKTLRQALEASPRGLGYSNSLDVATQLASALDCAHTQHGVVHRDVKPENIFLHDGHDWFAVVKLVDFGVARVLALDAMRTGGRMIGTAEYMSPEQIEGKTPGPKSDLYGLGLVLYEMLTGHMPFEDATELPAICLAHLQREPPPLSVYLPLVDAELERLVLSLLAKAPEARPRSASLVEAQLRALRVRLAVDLSGRSQATEELPIESLLAGLRERDPRDLAHAPTEIAGAGSTVISEVRAAQMDPMSAQPLDKVCGMPQISSGSPSPVPSAPPSFAPPVTDVRAVHTTARSPQQPYLPVPAPAPRPDVINAARSPAPTLRSMSDAAPIASAPRALRRRGRRRAPRTIALTFLAFAVLLACVALGMAIFRYTGKKTNERLTPSSSIASPREPAGMQALTR